MKAHFLTNRFDRSIMALAIPTLGALAADPLVSLVDTAFVGHLGAVPLGALGINTAVFSFAFFLFNFLAYATTPAIARAMAGGNHKSAGETILYALTLALVFGFFSMIVLASTARPVLHLMGAEGPLLDASLVYLKIRAFSAPAVLIITAGHGIFRGLGDTRTPFVITAWLNGINLALDPLFIFVFGWGIAGAAWATLIAQWAGAAGFLWLILHGKASKITVPLFIPRLTALKPFLKTGGALSLRTFALTGTLTLATAMAARISTVAVAAHQVSVQLWLFLALLVDALAIAAQTLVAQQLGARKPAEARAVAGRILLMGLMVGLFLGCAFLLLSHPLSRLFTSDPLVIDTILAILPFVACMQPVNALVFVGDGIFIGQEKFYFLAIAMAISALFGAGILWLGYTLGWGLPGIWWSITVFMGIRLLTLAWGFFRGRQAVPAN